MPFKISVDTSRLFGKVDLVAQQLPFATAVALTRTAQKIQKAEIQAMKTAFDRPTPYTLNSTFVKPATKTRLYAEVSLKNIAQKGQPASVYLAPQVFGGDRQLKRSELLLQRKGILPGGMLWVPGSGATLDAYGNMSRGQIGQILSALSGYNGAGFTANKSFRRGARVNKVTDQIFVITKKVGNLVPGVYMRTGSYIGDNKGLKPLMIFVTHANYKPILPFDAVAEDVYSANFQTEFSQAFNDAMSTAQASLRVA